MTGRPHRLIARPDFARSAPREVAMPFDVLSDVLKTVRLTGAAFFDVFATSPFVAEQPPRDIILPMILPGAERLIAYHAVTEGECYASVIGGETFRLKAGEVVVFTNGDPHVMASAPGMRGEAVLSDAFAAMGGGLPFFLKYGAEGPPTARLVCGFLACDAEAFNLLLDDLPPVIVAGGGDDAGWLNQFAQLAAAEMAGGRAGSASVLAKLSELMFIAVVRRHIETMPPQRAGWLAGLRDPAVGRALALFHGDPAHPWTMQELAAKAALSRSALYDRFADLVGTPPLHYLAQWRMQIAIGMLRRGDCGIAEIAAKVGYGSEAAFSRAFCKMMGAPPSAWRKRKVAS
jgi:AraC-like DNA-binding protein